MLTKTKQKGLRDPMTFSLTFHYDGGLVFELKVNSWIY